MFGSRNFLFAKVSAVFEDFKLFSWGQNTTFGNLGLGDLVDRSSPTQVGVLVDWATPEAGVYWSLCTKSNGTLWAWGRNSYYTLATGNNTFYSSPKQIGSLTSWEKPSAGNTSAACIRTDGTLWTWGSGTYGALGNGSTASRSSPVQIGSSTTWTAVSAGGQFMLAVDNGKLFAWGCNNSGQLGQGNTTNRSSPIQVGLLQTWATPAASTLRNYQTQFSVCTKTDGTLWAWGRNNYGQLGLGNTTDISSPVQVGTLTNWATPVVGAQQVLCTKTDGTLWAWGGGYTGVLGLGNSFDYSSPSQIGGFTNWLMPSTGGKNFSICTTIDGKIWSWGGGGNGRLGLGNSNNYSSPKQIGSLTPWVKIATGHSHAEATQGVETTAPVSLTVPVVLGTAIEGRTLTSTYGVWENYPSSFTFQWQRGTTNISGETSNFYLIAAADIGFTLRCVVTATNSFGSASVNTANTATVTAFTGGQLWIWGRNNEGQIGNSTTANNYSSPVQLGSSVTWTKVFGGEATMFAINAATELYAWGKQINNAFFGSALGIGIGPSESSPVQVSGTGWSKIAGTGQGAGTTAGIKTNGELWTWGYNSSGSLGRPGAGASVPTQVGLLTGWKEIASSYNTFMSIKTDGSLWGWGGNAQGELGLGNTTSYNSPKQVGSLLTWKFISGSSSSSGRRFQAVKTDGTLWGWGYNGSGILGTGNTTSYSSPVQIGALTNWVDIKVGSASGGTTGIAFGTKKEGISFTWGTGASGALGLNSLTNYNSPKQIRAGDWINASAAVGFAKCTIVKSDGSLWAWGDNTYGSLGIGDITARSSPIQVGSLKTWRVTRISSWGKTSAAIKIP